MQGFSISPKTGSRQNWPTRRKGIKICLFLPFWAFKKMSEEKKKENMCKVLLAITQWNIKKCSTDSVGYFEGEFKYPWKGSANGLTRNFGI